MIHYFGYGSNMDLTSLRAKGVEPLSSHRAIARGWKLLFNVHHWFRHEGGVGNIRPSGNARDLVMGVVHECEDKDLALLDAAESRGVGYDRTELTVETARGPVQAIAYVGLDGYLDDSCLPTRRYLNILVRGARNAGLDEAYVRSLQAHPLHQPRQYPPFEHPAIPPRVFDRVSLAASPQCTALAGAVFDMQGARWQHDCLKGIFGGKDMTLFHLKRLDTSDGTETLDDIRHDRLTDGQRDYLNAYLHEYATEYTYIGKYIYT